MLIGGNFGRSTSEVLTDDGQSTMHWDPVWPASDETIKYHIISSPSYLSLMIHFQRWMCNRGGGSSSLDWRTILPEKSEKL